jgi:hypothetical protein
MKTFEHVHTVISRVKPRLLVSMLLLSLSSAAILSSTLVNAAVYKKVDADGNVSFSDVPDKTAQMITVAPLSTIPAMSPELIESTLGNAQNPASKARVENYTLTIISPSSDQTYRRGADSFSANVQVNPELSNGDRLITLVDGKSSSGGSTADMDRGQHQFVAKIVNADGRVLVSKSISFNILQSSVKQQGYIGKLPVGKKN